MPGYADYVPTRRFGPALALSPEGRAVAYVADTGGQLNLTVHSLDGSPPWQLTEGTDWSVRQVGWAPDSATLFYAADRDGDEYTQLFSVTRDGSQRKQLTDDPKVVHYLGSDPVSPDGRWLVFTANDREVTDQDVLLRDLATGEVRRLLQRGGFLEAGPWAPDSSALVVMDFRSNTDSAPMVVRLDGTLTRLLADRPGKHIGAGWSADGSAVYLTTDLDRDLVALVSLPAAGGDPEVVTAPAWDIELATVVADGRLAVLSVNEDGRSRVVVRDLVTGAERTVDVPPGVVTAMSAARDGSRVGVLAATAVSPQNVGTASLRPDADGARAGASFSWVTDIVPTAADPAALLEPQLVRYPTHDGRDIPAYLYRPTGDGPFGVVLSIHGGPEWQERPDYAYNGLYQYLLSRGVGVLAPNVRGSTGYGTAYQKLIHHDWGGDELRDFEHAHRYLTGLDWVDPERIGVFGASFGGFATLSCVSRLPGRWAAAVSIVGPSNLVTFATSVPPTWLRFMAEWVGNPDTEAEFLRRRSPVTYVDQIDTPLFVIQGAQDQRVVQSESDQIVERLRDRGVQVRYDVYPDEGHGFTKRANEAQAMSDTAEFLIRHLAR